MNKSIRHVHCIIHNGCITLINCVCHIMNVYKTYIPMTNTRFVVWQLYLTMSQRRSGPRRIVCVKFITDDN